jgi:hypothetical protein
MRIFCRILEIGILSVMALGLPLAPLICAVIANDRSYLSRYFPTLMQCARMLREMLRVQVISRMLARRLQQRFYAGPDKAVHRAERIVGECTHCGKCCINKSCVYLQVGDGGESRCGIYNNWFWKQLTCGDYPISREEIDVYACPSFHADDVKVIAFPALAKRAQATDESDYATERSRRRRRGMTKGQ